MKLIDKRQTISIFDLFKIGHGPSSSHTIAPMKAGYHFLKTIRPLAGDAVRKAKAIDVRLYGSLSTTGKGHGTSNINAYLRQIRKNHIS